MNAEEEHFTDADDFEEVQSVVLAAGVVQGEETCLGQLPALVTGFDSRTARSRRRYAIDGSPAVSVDQHTVRAALAGKRLTHRDPDGKVEQLTSDEAVNLVCASPVQPAKAVAYLDVLQKHLLARRRIDVKERAQVSPAPTATIPPDFSVRSRRCRSSCEGWSSSHRSAVVPAVFWGTDSNPTWNEDLGLDSGFSRFNDTTNGLDTGLSVVAAAPSIGKTSFAFQMCQQVAEIERVPVIFVSLEQSAAELRFRSLRDSRGSTAGSLLAAAYGPMPRTTWSSCSGRPSVTLTSVAT